MKRPTSSDKLLTKLKYAFDKVGLKVKLKPVRLDKQDWDTISAVDVMPEGLWVGEVVDLSAGEGIRYIVVEPNEGEEIIAAKDFFGLFTKLFDAIVGSRFDAEYNFGDIDDPDFVPSATYRGL